MCFSSAAAAPKSPIRKTQQERLEAAERPELVVILAGNADPERFAHENGLRLVRQMKSDPDAYIFNTEKSKAPHLTQEEKKTKLEADKRVRKAYVNHQPKLKLYGFAPNDPYFHRNTPSVGDKGDWHLINELGTGIDVRVQDVWGAGLTGSGVVLAVVDDSMQINHPDLSPRYSAANSWNFGNNTAVPNPGSSQDMHGTATAGIAAAAGGNGIGVCGAAPQASLACLRLSFYTVPSSEADCADADKFHSSGANTSIKIKNHSYGMTDPWMSMPLETAAFAASAAAGTIHVFASGNGRGSSNPVDITMDANKGAYQCDPNVITIAALDQYGKIKPYSSYGACVFASAPSGVISTDRTSFNGYNPAQSSFTDQDYVDGMEGTSFSAPLTAGVLALVKQAQPALNVRFAKHLLARCSDLVDRYDASTESGGGWVTNGAGLKFNENYGFGLVNAKRLVETAKKCKGVTALQTEKTGTISANLVIPDNSRTGVTAQFRINSPTPLEEMLVTVNITHTYIGDLEIYLTSPRGTTSRLMIKQSADDTKNLRWTLLSNAFWGEGPQGTWKLNVRDLVSGDTGWLDSFAATARMGNLTLPTGTRVEKYE